MDNELNAGLGLNYTAHEDQRGIGFVEAGLYGDSRRNLAKVAGIGYQYKLGKRWQLGGALLAVQSETYNQGKAFIAPIPLLTYDFGPVKVNAMYVPKYGDYNQFAVFGVYFSIPLTKVGSAR